jgi:hypothetical protein
MKRTLVLAAALLAITAAEASAASLGVSPTTTRAGQIVRVFGSVGGGCVRGDVVTIISRAFSHRHKFAGQPAISTHVRRRGAFSVHTRIPASRRAGSYSIRARCGGGSFGDATLRVTA